jgi:hypothetical protein
VLNYRVEWLVWKRAKQRLVAIIAELFSQPVRVKIISLPDDWQPLRRKGSSSRFGATM